MISAGVFKTQALPIDGLFLLRVHNQKSESRNLKGRYYNWQIPFSLFFHE